MRRRRTQKGNALIEFALSATLLVSLFTGIFQFGYTMIAVQNLVTSVRGGGRFAAVTNYTAGDYQSRIKNMVVYGQPTAGTDPVLPGLTAANVEVVLTPNAGVPETVTVRIINFSVNALFRTFNFNGKPAVTFPYNGS
jgi:Flp pilus assembly protein TadG